MCASHQEASPTTAAGSPSSPVSGRGPRGEAGDGISNRVPSASSAAVTVRTMPSSSASRTRVPVTLTTTFGDAAGQDPVTDPDPAAACAAHRVPPACTTAAMPSGADRSAVSCRCHIRWNSTGSTRSRSPASSAPSNRPRPPANASSSTAAT